MSSDLLRRAAETMRREETPFFDALADWLETVAYAIDTADPERVLGFGEPTAAREIAGAYLADPGDLPAVPE